MKQDANSGSQCRGLTTANSLPGAGPPYLTFSVAPGDRQQALLQARKWGLGESEHVGWESASFQPYGPAGLRLQGPAASRHIFTLGPPVGQVGKVGPPSHLPGGQTGPFRLLPLWVQLAQPLLGLLLVLWDPEAT